MSIHKFNSFLINLLAVFILFVGYTSTTNLYEPYNLYLCRREHINVQQMECLAKNIYFEARGEPMVGQFAVAQVVINRVKSPDYPDSICGVVYQTNQFSWVKERFHRITNGKDWANALNVAYSVLTNDKPYSKIIPKTVMYYHTITSHPVWDHSMIRVATIGNHIFYRMKE